MYKNDKIIFEENDTPQERATKTILFYAGSSELKAQMKKLNVDYTKDYRGLKTVFTLRGEKIGKIKVTL